MRSVNLGKVLDFPQGKMRGFDIDGEYIIVGSVSGSFYALSGKCSHKGCSLSRGALQGFIVRCPAHGSEFVVRTGRVVRNVRIPLIGRCTALRRFTTFVEGDSVYVDL